MASGDIFQRECTRCEELYRPCDVHEVFKIQYETVGFIDNETNKEEPYHAWRTVDLCGDCQKDLRMEFYRRGLVRHG